MHTLKLSKNSILLRIYRTAWPIARESRINFCKLFWGVLFCPIGYTLRLIFWPIDKVITAIDNRKANKPPKPELSLRERLDAAEARIAEAEARAEARKKTLWYRVGNSVLEFLDRFFSRFGPIIARVLIVLAGIAVAIGVGWVIVTEFVTFLIYVGTLLALGAVVAGIVWLIQETTFADKASKPFIGVGRFFKHGYKSLKYRTCPLVEIQDDTSPVTT
jgi:hypothetical protein